MPFTLATWNINSVRFRIDIVTRFLKEVLPENSAPEKGSPCSGGFGGTR